MQINPILKEMQTMSLEAQKTGAPITGQQISQDFSALLSSAINNVNSLQATSSDLASRFDKGDRSVDLFDVMIARNKSSVAFDATVQVRNKLVEAYKELMNMPV